MESDNPTTVRLTGIAKKLKEAHAPFWGLKNILSAGLVLFDKLSSDEQKAAIAEANGITEQDEDKAAAQEIVAAAEAHEVEPHRKKGGKSAKSA